MMNCRESAEIFQRKLQENFEGLPRVICVADDILIYCQNQEDHNNNRIGLLKRCAERNIKLSKEKCVQYRSP